MNAAQGFKLLLHARHHRKVPGVEPLETFESPAFGRVVMLGGAIQVTTGDEFIYHEMMAHVPLFTHGAAQDVLIIGGGDGGIAREVLRHAGVERLTLVEIDRAVIDLCLAQVPEVSGGAFDDPRLRVVIADGAQFVAETDRRFDVVIVDSPDPEGPAAVLFTADLYANCRRIMRPGGVMVTQSGMPFLTPDWLRGHAETLRSVFGSIEMFLTTVPSYTGGPMAHGLMRTAPRTPVDLATLKARQAAAAVTGRYWSPAVHLAAFALPGYVAELLEQRPNGRV